MASGEMRREDTERPAKRVPRKRKKRVEVSSSSSSENSSTSDSSVQSLRDESDGSSPERSDQSPLRKKSRKGLLNEDVNYAEAAKVSDIDNDKALLPAADHEEEEEDFSAFYLRTVTAELAEDLDKVRRANDFNERSMGILVRALRQGEAGFEPEEKKSIMGRP